MQNDIERKDSLDNLLENEGLARRYEQFRNIDTDKAFERFRQRVGDPELRAKESELATEHVAHPTKQSNTTPMTSKWRWLVAAVGVAAAVTGVMLFTRPSAIDVPMPADGSMQIAAIQPGHSQALLTIGGEQIQLTGEETSVDTLFGATGMMMDDVPTVRVDVPRGAEYRLVLSDGTMVHLNSQSSISFPQTFASDARRVAMTGEAYFEVNHQDNVPFIVGVNGVEVKQYGTHFNVDAYTDGQVEVTLVEGSVGVTPSGMAETMLTPGHQAVASDGKVTVRAVDVATFTSWICGEYVFDNRDLSSIARVLSRWYDVNIRVDDSLNGARFTGTLNRNGQLVDILDAIAEITGMKYLYDSNTIILHK